MKNIESLINSLAELLSGHNALIQVQVENDYFIRKIGDINKLAERPKVQVITPDSSFVVWMKEQINSLQLKNGTISNHKNTLKHLYNFMPDIRFSDIDYTLVLKFHRFLIASKLSTNTIAKIMKIFRRYVSLAMDEDIFVTNAFRKYHIQMEKTQKSTLSERELKKLENVDTKNEEELKTKSTFLLATYTGLRYSDASDTHKHNIKTINKKKWLCLNQKKTGVLVKIPISNLFDGKALPLIGITSPSNARCNIVIKRLCKRAHIKKHITMHTARRTCASILTARGVSINTVQHILGHESIKTTEKYINTLDTTINKEVKKAFR